jgi:conjugative relaxase-like TrwC/TraI family protein
MVRGNRQRGPATYAYKSLPKADERSIRNRDEIAVGSSVATASERQNYGSRDQQGHSEWQGKLAEQWGLSGPVGNEHFARLTEGQHPETEVQLVRHQVSKTYEGKLGKEVTSVEHRAGWDATFSAPKSVSHFPCGW